MVYGLVFGGDGLAWFKCFKPNCYFHFLRRIYFVQLIRNVVWSEALKKNNKKSILVQTFLYFNKDK